MEEIEPKRASKIRKAFSFEFVLLISIPSSTNCDLQAPAATLYRFMTTKTLRLLNPSL